ncbi:MAG TPA: alpha/beta hydrolase [Pyrinomonadaceae bacterium]
MSLDTTKITSSAFDKLYEKVPADQVARLLDFRRTHPVKHLVIGGAHWEYIACGQGEQTLLFLPGALSIGESVFPLISALENEYRIIAPSYALTLTMTGLCDGIARILQVEDLSRIHVLGGSYGGLVAQYFVRRHPDKARSLVLSHTFMLTPKYAKPLWITGKLFSRLPRSVFVPMLKLRLNKILLSKLRKTGHPEHEFWRAYLNEAIASDLCKEVFINQNNCLLECMQQPQFTSVDLKDWQGKILIIESDDDVISEHDRERLRNTYPHAEVYTFHGAGHASSILKREEVVSVIRYFLQKV